MANIAAYLAGLGPNNEQSFADFFESWMEKQKTLLQELIAVSKTNQETKLTEEEENERKQQVVIPLVERVMNHYSLYYETKCRASNRDILAMLTPSWTSSLENAFYWIGGWRPSTLFQVLLTKSGIQFGAKMQEILEGVYTGDLARLSAEQHREINKMQLETTEEERVVTEELAEHQDTVASKDMVELSHTPSEMEDVEKATSAMEDKEQGLKIVLERADCLRLETLQGVVKVLDPNQALHFLIAVAQLHLMVREWGNKKDAARENINTENANPSTSGSANGDGNGSHSG